MCCYDRPSEHDVLALFVFTCRALRGVAPVSGLHLVLGLTCGISELSFKIGCCVSMSAVFRSPHAIAESALSSEFMSSEHLSSLMHLVCDSSFLFRPVYVHLAMRTST